MTAGPRSPGTPSELIAAARRLAERSCSEQGLELQPTDPGALAKVATAVRSAGSAPQRRTG